MEYGALGLTATTLVIMAIVSAGLTVAATGAYALGHRTGMIPHFAGIILLLMIVVNWWTSISSDGLTSPVVWSVLLIAGQIILPFLALVSVEERRR